MRHPIRCDGPEQKRDGIGFVVIGGAEATGAGSGDHRNLVGIALAGCVAFDRADRNALVRYAPQFGPSGQRGHEAAIDMGGVGRDMAADLLEPDGGDGTGQPVQFSQPVGEAQIAHAAAIKAAGAEAGRAAGDQTVMAAQGPAGRGAQIEGEDAAVA
jgi:hypothetical protein